MGRRTGQGIITSSTRYALKFEVRVEIFKHDCSHGRGSAVIGQGKGSVDLSCDFNSHVSVSYLNWVIRPYVLAPLVCVRTTVLLTGG